MTKIILKRPSFLSALSHVQSIVERKAVTPILSHVLLDANGSNLVLSTTDLDISMVETIEAEVVEPGTFTVAVNTLHDIVRKLPDGVDIELKVAEDGNQVAIKAGRSRFNLPTLPAEDFPILKASDMPHTFQLTSEEARHLLNQTRFCMSTDESRYYLNGLYLHGVESADGPLLRAVATDGHRLAQAEIPAPKGSEGMPGVIIPRKTVGELARLLDHVMGDVGIALSLTQISFEFASVRIQSRLIDGTFPDYEQVIPKNNTNILIANVRQVREAVDRVALLCQDRSSGIHISLEGGRILLSSSGSDQGSATEEVEAEYAGDRVEVGFNARYIMDVLQQIDADQMTVHFEDAQVPLVFKSSETDDAFYVLMPMRV